MKKLLVFHPYLATYRIDIYNKLTQQYQVKVLLTGSEKELSTLGFDLEKVNQQAQFDYTYYQKGLYLGRHLISTIYYDFIKDFRPNIVIAHEYGINTLAAIALKKEYKIKLFITCDDSFNMASTYSRKREYLRRFIIKYVDGIITVSTHTQQYLQAKYPTSAKKFIYFPIIQDDQVLFPRILQSAEKSRDIIERYKLDNKKIVLFVGRLENIKRIDLLIKAYSAVKTIDSKLVIVGDGSLRQVLQALVTENGEEENIIFTGTLTGADLYAWYYISHIFVLPSNKEAFGAVVNEALVGGCYSIVSDHAGASCLITPNNGCIFESENLQDLKNKLSLLLKNVPIHKLHASLMPQTFEQYFNNLNSHLLCI